MFVLLFAGIVPRFHVNTPATDVLDGRLNRKLRPAAGNVSVKTTPVASAGPRLLTTSVCAKLIPVTTGLVGPVNVICKSAAGLTGLTVAMLRLQPVAIFPASPTESS